MVGDFIFPFVRSSVFFVFSLFLDFSYLHCLLSFCHFLSCFHLNWSVWFSVSLSLSPLLACNVISLGAPDECRTTPPNGFFDANAVAGPLAQAGRKKRTSSNESKQQKHKVIVPRSISTCRLKNERFPLQMQNFSRRLPTLCP